MARPQFSIRALFFVTSLICFTAALSYKLPNSPDARLEFFVLSCLLGPPALAVIGFFVGQEAKAPWWGTLIGTLLGTIFWFGLIFAVRNSLW